MKYLITGNKGFIGTNLTNYLLSQGHEVVGIDFPFDLRTRIPGYDNLDVVVHLASETNVRKSIEKPKLFFDTNISLMFSALYIAKSCNAKLIFTSSCGAANPTNPYAASKLACEALCITYREIYKMNISVLRLSNVYGPFSSHKDSVITNFIRQKLANEPITIYGSGHQKRDFVYVQDVCEAIYHAKDDFIEVSTGKLTAINSVAKLLKIEDIIYTTSINGEVLSPNSNPSIGHKTSLRKGLNLTLKWFQEN